jgi:hypothetical protein
MLRGCRRGTDCRFLGMDADAEYQRLEQRNKRTRKTATRAFCSSRVSRAMQRQSRAIRFRHGGTVSSGMDYPVGSQWPRSQRRVQGDYLRVDFNIPSHLRASTMARYSTPPCSMRVSSLSWIVVNASFTRLGSWAEFISSTAASWFFCHQYVVALMSRLFTNRRPSSECLP